MQKKNNIYKLGSVENAYTSNFNLKNQRGKTCELHGLVVKNLIKKKMDEKFFTIPKVLLTHAHAQINCKLRLIFASNRFNFIFHMLSKTIQNFECFLSTFLLLLRN